MIVTRDMVEAYKTKKGGYSLKQVKMAQLLVGSDKWKSKLIGMEVTEGWWNDFAACVVKTKKAREAKNKSMINPFPVSHSGWNWKPEKQDIPLVKEYAKPDKAGISKNRGKNKARKIAVSRKEDSEFFISKEWRALRVRVLQKYECRCMMCGRSPKNHGIVIHVDHIKPRSKYPELSLDFDNLQLLCEDCNIGKGNKYETDYRPDITPDYEWDLLESMPITMK